MEFGVAIIAIMVAVFVLWSNYQDIKLIKCYQQKRMLEQRTRPSTPVPWHSGFPYGGFHTGPWNWSRQQYYYHPGVGWYASPFSL